MKKDLTKPSAEKTFSYKFVTYLKDSNAYGNNYFARYFEWQGVCREAWFHSCIAEDFLFPLGVWVTKTAHNEYLKETKPFTKITCKLNVSEVKMTSFYIKFLFCDSDDESIIYSEGYQKILFANHDKKITKIPSNILDKIKSYELSF